MSHNTQSHIEGFLVPKRVYFSLPTNYYLLVDIDYVFPHFTGILVTSVIYFAIYCALKKNKPIVYPKVILPALASGTFTGVVCYQITLEEDNSILDCHNTGIATLIIDFRDNLGTSC